MTNAQSAVTKDEASPVASEFLRQALDFESPRLGWFELHSLWEANPAPTTAPPLIWIAGAKAHHGTDPLEGAEVVDGKVWAEPVMAANYTIHAGGLGDAFYTFEAEANESSVTESLVGNLTTERAFFAVAMTLGVNACNGRTLAPIEAIDHVIAIVEKWVKGSQRASEKDAGARLLAALFGNKRSPE